MTDNICRRVLEHKLKISEGFTSKYNVDKLVYYETFEGFGKAANREKQLKAGARKKKLELICKSNPDWHDLYLELSASNDLRKIK